MDSTFGSPGRLMVKCSWRSTNSLHWACANAEPAMNIAARAAGMKLVRPIGSPPISAHAFGAVRILVANRHSLVVEHLQRGLELRRRRQLRRRIGLQHEEPAMI